jgi:hypothetical protein
MNNVTFKGKQRNNVNKAEPHPLSSVVVEISSPRNQRGSKISWGGGDCD